MPLSPDGRPLADFGSRLLAYMIDVGILSAITMVVSLPFLLWFVFSWTSEMSELTDPYSGTDPFAAYDRMFTGYFVPFLLMELGLIVFLMVAYYIYAVEMMFRSGQTLGKKLIKVRVVPLEPGATLTRGMAAKRYLVEFVGGMVVPLFSYLDGLWQLWDKPYQQTLHDKVAKTVVVKVAP
ncbi:RDD family protein [Actinoplanes sp. NPDC049681]|uniref:RDD family protein n=1 Tax=Actinoplanes sp. NPDC049681 TaxID=3363905 RepID=UPI00379F5A2B